MLKANVLEDGEKGGAYPHQSKYKTTKNDMIYNEYFIHVFIFQAKTTENGHISGSFDTFTV